MACDQNQAVAEVGLCSDLLVRCQGQQRLTAGLSQDELAHRIGLSRPQLANAEAQRFGPSQTAAARLLAVIARLRPRQIGFDLPLHAVAVRQATAAAARL